MIYYLSGLTCTDDNFITKAGAQRVAAELGVAIIAPDTSPRGAGIEGEEDGWDFGTGAGFYVNATEPKWSKNYRMYDYVTQELPFLVHENFPVDKTKMSVFGHSMGGHGALICALKNPGMYKSCSAFSPICNPIHCPWGEKAFSGYLGTDRNTWKAYDATELCRAYNGPKIPILCDQGLADDFYPKQLLSQHLVEASVGNDKVDLSFRFHGDYDHSYYFISTFMEDHLRFHASRLI